MARSYNDILEDVKDKVNPVAFARELGAARFRQIFLSPSRKVTADAGMECLPEGATTVSNGKLYGSISNENSDPNEDVPAPPLRRFYTEADKKPVTPERRHTPAR